MDGIGIKQNEDKRIHICKVEFAFAKEVDMEDYPGEYCRCDGNFKYLKCINPNLREKQDSNGEPIEQELSLEIVGNNEDVTSKINMLVNNYIVLRLTYSNGDIRIVGSSENPILLSLDLQGAPLKHKLIFKRLVADKAKYLLDS